MEKMVFGSLEPTRVEVEIDGKPYCLQEASESDVAKYHNANIKQTRYSEKGKVAGLGDVAQTRALLVSLCLWEMRELNGQMQRFPVKEATVSGWLSRYVKALFEKAKEISEIDDDTEEALAERIERDREKLKELRASREAGETPEKNSPESMTDTSASPTS